MTKRVFLQVEELWETLITLCLCNRAGHQHNICIRGHRMRPFDIQRSLKGPVDHSWIAGVEFNRAQWCDYFERRRIRQAIAHVEDVQIMGNRWAAIRVDDDNRLAFTGKASLEYRRYIIGITYFLGTITWGTKLFAALLVSWRRWTTLDQAQVFVLKGDSKGLRLRVTARRTRKLAH